MKKTGTAAIIGVSLALAVPMGFAIGLVAYVPHTALAADAKKTLSAKVSKPLQEAIAAAKAGKTADALAKAQEAEKISGKSPYETFLVDQVLAGLYAQTKDYANAAMALEAEQATGEMSPADSNTALKQIAGTYYSLKNYPKVVEIGSKYLKEADPADADVLIMVAQAQYLQNNYKGASDGIHAAIDAARTSNKPVKEEWLQLLLSSEQHLGDDAGTIAALEQLIAVDPKGEYWKNLIAYTERTPAFKSNSSAKTTLDLYLVKFTTGTMSTAQEYADMTELALQDGLPGLAKKVIDKGVSVGVLGKEGQTDRETHLAGLANTQADSDRKTLAVGEAEARKAKTGDPLVKVGEAYWSYGQYDKAIDAIEAGMAKGVTNVDDAKLRLGIVYLAAGKPSQAADDFKTIAPDSVPGKLSQLWMVASTSPSSSSNMAAGSTP